MIADIFMGTLDLDSIILNSNKIIIGYVDDVFGSINQPFYLIKFYPWFQ